jgi:hypothetical protein
MDMLQQSVLFTGILYLVIIGIALAQYRYCKRTGEPISWIIAGVHGIVYTVAFFVLYQTNNFDRVFFNLWSITLRVHFLITLVSIEWARLSRMRGRGNGC